MNILVACEESQEVCKAFRFAGHRAFSCDIQPCSGGFDAWHIQQDVIPLLNGNCRFTTQAGNFYIIPDKWDLIIAFPPCTNLAASGARWFKEKQADGRQAASIDFFMKFVNADCGMIAIENPVGIMSNIYRKPDQIIQPYEYGHPARKSTCLWLKGLPKLVPTEIVKPNLVSYKCKNGKIATFSADYGAGGGENGKRRSKTYSGIAAAMAEQWGKQG